MVARPDNLILLGRKDLIYKYALQCRSGIYLGQFLFGLGQKSRDKYEWLKRLDISYIYLSEEGAVYRGDAEDWRLELNRRFDPLLLEAEDYLWSWGAFQAEHYRALKPACADNILITGHPRFDLIKKTYQAYFAPEVEQLRQEIGPFILVNTNFSAANHALGLKMAFGAKNGFDPRDERCRSRHIGVFSHLAMKMAAYIRLANNLVSAFPSHTVVVRPHPGEQIAPYQTVLGEIPGIQVRRDSGAIPWLIAADVLVNDGCTTGIEASPHTPLVINYRPVLDASVDLKLPHEVGVNCFSEEEVIATIRSHLEVAGERHHRSSNLLNSMIANMAEEFDSFSQCVKLLHELQVRKRNPAISIDWRRERLRPGREWLKGLVKRRRVSGLKEQYDRVKYPGIDLTFFAERFERSIKIAGTRADYRFYHPGLAVIAGEE